MPLARLVTLFGCGRDGERCGAMLRLNLLRRTGLAIGIPRTPAPPRPPAIVVEERTTFGVSVAARPVS